MAEAPDLLPLRDIHLPDPVPWWPPAPGWWMLFALAAATSLAAWFAVRHYRRGRLLRESRREFARIREQYRSDGDATRLAVGLSELLRRVVISRFPEKALAGLTGDAWLQTLDCVGRLVGFETGPGRVLADAPYRPCNALDGDTLLLLCERWLRRVTGER